MKVIWTPELEAEKMKRSKERFEQCQRARNYKAEYEKAMKHEAWLDKVAHAIVYMMIGVAIFGGMALALYLGSH